MKMTYRLSTFLICLLLNSFLLRAQTTTDQEPTGLPGDHFSLEGALEMFKKAGSPEEFEKLLNAEENKVNNLDLDNDGNIDYLRVVNMKENDVQVFIIQALVSESESQDIAVIELEKTGRDQAVIQIIGDEDIYGESTIVEPSEETDLSVNPSLSDIKGPNVAYPEFNSGNGIIVNVWSWPFVRFAYAPAYTIWISPWNWHRRPIWWKPWRPLAWHAYHPFRHAHRHRYAVVHTHRVVYGQRIYRPARVSSVTVRTRNHVAVNNYRVNRTVQKKTVTGPRGNQAQVTKRSTTVNGRSGKATRTTTTVRKKRK